MDPLPPPKFGHHLWMLPKLDQRKNMVRFGGGKKLECYVTIVTYKTATEMCLQQI